MAGSTKIPKGPRRSALRAGLDILSLLALAVQAGGFIALGAMIATTVLAKADGVLPIGLSRLLSKPMQRCGRVILRGAGAREILTAARKVELSLFILR